MPRQRLTDLEDAVQTGAVATLDAFNAAIKQIDEHYRDDEWAWVKTTYAQVFDTDPAELTGDGVREATQMLLKVKTKFLNLVTADAQKEFSEVSRLGYGQDGQPHDAERDFRQVRGLYEENQFMWGYGKKISGFNIGVCWCCSPEGDKGYKVQVPCSWKGRCRRSYARNWKTICCRGF